MTRNRFAALWIWVFVFPLALDYKAVDKTSGHLAQFMLAVPALGAGVVLLLIAPRFARRSRLRALVTLALLLCVLGSIVPQWLQGNDTGNYLRVLLPFVLFLLGYLAACRPWSAARVEQFEKAIFWTNVVALVFTLVYGLVTVGGGGLVNVRYRIVSPTFLGLQAVLLHEFVIAKRFTPLTLAIFIGMLVIELLSVTRSLLVGSACLFLLAAWMSAPSSRHLLKAVLRVAAVAMIGGGVIMAGMSMFPSSAKEWTTRIFASEHTESGKDPTTITRLAELKDQYDQVTSSATTLLAGEGYGHYYRYSPAYLPDLEGQIAEKDFYAIHEWSAGHNFWGYQLFAGGLLFGIAFPVALLYALVRCAIAYRKWRAIAPAAPDLPVLGRAILLVAALPAVTIGGNPLGERLSGVVFGAALGLMIATYSQLRRTIKTRTPQRARRAAAAAPGTPHHVTARDATGHKARGTAGWRLGVERPAPEGGS